MAGKIEKDSGVHSNEHLQYSSAAKTTAEKYAEYHKLDFSKCDSNKVIEIVNKTKVLQE